MAPVQPHAPREMAEGGMGSKLGFVIRAAHHNSHRVPRTVRLPRDLALQLQL